MGDGWYGGIRSGMRGHLATYVTTSLRRYAVNDCKLKQNANGALGAATVVQVLQDSFYVFLHVIFYL